jgi:hypothetical protein
MLIIYFRPEAAGSSIALKAVVHDFAIVVVRLTKQRFVHERRMLPPVINIVYYAAP